MGNTCRSPLAKVILEQKLQEREQFDRFEIDSAALYGMSLSSASKNARAAIEMIYGEDLLATHKAKNLTDELIKYSVVVQFEN